MSRLKMTFLDRPAPDWAGEMFKHGRLGNGRPPKRLLGELADAQKRRCYYCEKLMHLSVLPWAPPRDRATLDHVVPLSRGGSNARSNLVAACYDCNQAKAALSEAEFRAVLLVRASQLSLALSP